MNKMTQRRLNDLAARNVQESRPPFYTFTPQEWDALTDADRERLAAQGKVYVGIDPNEWDKVGTDEQSNGTPLE